MINIKYFFLFALSASLYSSENISAESLTDKEVEFAWDAHHVLIKPNILGMLAIIFKQAGFKVAKAAAAFGYEHVLYCVNGTSRRTHQLVRDLCSLQQRNPGATGKDYQKIIDAYDSDLGAVAEKMAASWVINPGMQELIEELHELGYVQRIATNMASEEYKNIADEHPHFFKYIDGGLTVDIEETPIVRKPSLDYFNRYHEKYNADRTKTIIFSDDNTLYAQAAAQTGMIGITFKNAEQARAELRNMGIPLKQL